jgi:hypothetical protein
MYTTKSNSSSQPPPSCGPSRPAHWSRALLAVSLVSICTLAKTSAQIAAWDFFGENTANATSAAELFDASLDSSNLISRGAGAAASTGANSFRTQGFQNNGIATTNTDYFQTTISAAAGYSLSLSTIDAKSAGTGTFAASPGVTSQFAYSLDGTNFTLIGSPSITTGTPATLGTISLAGIPALQNVSDSVTVTIRYYASGQTTTGGWGFNSPSAGAYGLAFGGTVTSVGGDLVSPAVVSKSPATGSTGILPSTNLAITYDESVVPGSGSIAIKKTSDDSLVETVTVPSALVTISGPTATINPAALLDYSTSYYVEVSAGAFTDASTNPAPAITGNGTWSFTTRAAPQIVINQYYEGTSSSRFIELKNLTGSPIALDDYRLAAWSASDSPSNQAWKTGTDITPRVSSLVGKTIPANGYFLFADNAATAPNYAIANNDLAAAFPSGTAFSGNGSVVLYNSATNDLNSAVDAISITGTEGTDISFYRLNNLTGFDFTTGTSILSYSSTWGTKTISQVDSANFADDWYLQASQAPKFLTLGITPTSFSEGAGTAAATGTITRSGSTVDPLVVTISVNDTSEATAPTTVTILAGSDNATFPIDAVNDLYLDGDITVTITASAATFTTAVQQVTVLDELTDLPFPVVINELDSDQLGTDTGEFVELYNNSSNPVSLDGVVLVFYNGANNTSYLTVNLSGNTIAANGYFVVGNSAVPNVGVTFTNNTMQNGEDAVALYLGTPATYPNGTAVATTAGKLVDAVVYDTSDPDATALIAALTPGKPQVDEGANPASETVALARIPNGGAAFDSTLYVAQSPTPGATNILPPPNNYSNWISGVSGFYPGETNTDIIGFGKDPDNDGVPNGVEALIGGTPNSPGVFATTELVKSGNVFTFVYPQARNVPSGVTAAYEWSADLLSWHTTGQSDGVNTVTLADGLYDDDNVSPTVTYQVTATVTVGTPVKLFVRVIAHN